MAQYRAVLLAASASLGLMACAATSPDLSGPTTEFIQATPEAIKPMPEVVAMPVPVAPPQLRELPKSARSKPVPIATAIKRANEEARSRSTPAGFIQATQIFDYMPGSLYEVWTSPGYVSMIALRPGEQLIRKAAGDTVRWVVGETVTGTGQNSQTLVLVKPLRPDLSTNLLITTDQRAYLIELKSVKGGVYNASVAWNYPQAEVEEMRANVKAQHAREQETISTGVALDKMNFSYSIETVEGDEPAWKPQQVFDDGRKTYVQFPPNLGVLEAPPLFVLGSNGDAQLVNYRVKKNFYVVDRLLSAAELRLGEEPQTIVRIERKD